MKPSTETSHQPPATASTRTATDYDYVICGAGAAGLSLAYHLNLAGLTDKRILLIDRAPKTKNDRTWCFWEAGDGPFEHVVFRCWDRVFFHGDGFSSALDLAPYRYKMLRGIDFYQFMQGWLSTQANIAQMYGDVSDVQSAPDGAVVRVDGREIRAELAFNSIPLASAPRRDGYHYLLQHFKGWVVRTSSPRFDPQLATLMDFRIPQNGDCRFCYVLPFDAGTALVEYTVFSPALLTEAEYEAGLRAYIADQLRLDDYAVLEKEFGVIPMTDAPFASSLGERVINIGTAGGRTKPSTGFTFQRIQRQSAHIARSLRTGRSSDLFKTPSVATMRHSLFDGALLNVLDQHRQDGQGVFADLFRHNRASQVFKFLDEDTSVAEEMRIMSGLNAPVFVAATASVIAQRALANVRQLRRQ